jgi:tRNA modification GTPase
VRDPDETIVAVSTPPGRGAIALVRLSGPGSLAAIRDLVRPPRILKEPPRTARYCRLEDRTGRMLDRVLLTVFPAPFSYTGQQVVEISCHGSPPVVELILRAVLEGGARLAEPGEFTLRAFLAGKLDLAQAEAVRDLVESQTAFQAEIASEQLEGRLSRLLAPVRSELVRVISHLETALEFVEEAVNPQEREVLTAALEALEAKLEELAGSFALGRLVREGGTVTIVGRPNVGKSSIFNKLLSHDRAIVTPLPGTTRDALSEWIELGGIPAHLVDTAGIRESEELVERLGVAKSLDYLERADAICLVLDGSAPFGPGDGYVWAAVGARRPVVAVNKADLPARLEIPGELARGSAAVVRVSALVGTNLGELREALAHALVERSGVEERTGAVVANLRQQECLKRASRHLAAGRGACAAGASEEIPLFDLRRALDAIGEVTGATTVEDLLDSIFSTFCIGK